MDHSLRLPDGTDLAGALPLVVIGPNGSGKTRQARLITSPTGAPVDFVNALRNTRVTTEIPAMGMTSARANLTSSGQQARGQYWEQVQDFDYLLARLHAEDAAAAIAFRDEARTSGSIPGGATSSMEKLQGIWANVFPGRTLWWQDNIPMVRSVISGEQVEYQGHYMSDGEKAALYVAGKVLVADSGILVIDEPETHFHSLLAVELWNALEHAREDVRFVYVTHDLTFALSRLGATFVLAHPTLPMRVIELGNDLPSDTFETLLGAASFSFYAQRLILCEGDTNGPDHLFYRSWFDNVDTVVRPVGSSEMVIRSVNALKNTSLVVGLETIGIVDRDYHSDEMLQGLPESVVPLPVHELESLYCLPSVVSAVARHVGKGATFDEAAYVASLRSAVSEGQRHAVIVERWKRRIEGPLLALIGTVASRVADLDRLVVEVPRVFESANWAFSPAEVLADEQQTVEALIPSGPIEEVLRLMPGKSLVSLPASTLGLRKDHYINLINLAIAGEPGHERLGGELVVAFTSLLPRRAALRDRQPSAEATPAPTDGLHR